MNRHGNALKVMVLMAMSSLSPVVARTQSENGVIQHAPMIEVHLNEKGRLNGRVVLEVVVKNQGPDAVYVVTDPRLPDNSPGPYIGLDDADPTTLVCSSQFYPPNPFGPFSDGTNVHLVRLNPGESHTELMKLQSPLRTTQPPFSAAPGTKAVLDKAIKRVEVHVGVLPMSSSLMELVVRKRIPHDAFTGMEQIQVGSALKSLYENQTLVRSNAVAISLE
jgi:hypothetical protein